MDRFSHLKKGDIVVLDYYSTGIWNRSRAYEFATVTEVGVKKIKTDRGDFSVQGHKWGSGHYDSGWRLDTMSVEEAKQRNVEIHKENHRANLAYKLGQVNWKERPLETLEAVYELLAETQPA
jgi:DNA-directed RNA polymerase subunit RPC12/RpoP